MKRELGIARCGLACCLCSENEHCNGCNSGDCPDKDWCENRKCSFEKSVEQINEEIMANGIGHHWMIGYGNFLPELKNFCRIQNIKYFEL